MRVREWDGEESQGGREKRHGRKWGAKCMVEVTRDERTVFLNWRDWRRIRKWEECMSK